MPLILFPQPVPNPIRMIFFGLGELSQLRLSTALADHLVVRHATDAFEVLLGQNCKPTSLGLNWILGL